MNDPTGAPPGFPTPPPNAVPPAPPNMALPPGYIPYGANQGAVLTMMWMFRTAKNQQLTNRMGTWKPGRAIGGWFVPPIVLYVVPFLMFRELWKSSRHMQTTREA